MFSLEALLSGGPGEGGATQVAERLAFLLGRDMQDCIEVKNRAKKYFAHRGPLAHGSRKEVPWATLLDLEVDCAAAIRRFASDHLHRETFEAFLKWVEEQKFSTPPPALPPLRG